ncbi:MAG: hypothetical protein HYV29_03445 [Ignavibacteriales bacterium]|nr:hypothetical protein [Ignavibacteriales bacterium]
MVSFIVLGGVWDIPNMMLVDHRKSGTYVLNIRWEILSHDGSAVDAVRKRSAISLLIDWSQL